MRRSLPKNQVRSIRPVRDNRLNPCEVFRCRCTHIGFQCRRPYAHTKGSGAAFHVHGMKCSEVRNESDQKEMAQLIHRTERQN
jgi:hypothetical protein